MQPCGRRYYSRSRTAGSVIVSTSSPRFPRPCVYEKRTNGGKLADAIHLLPTRTGDLYLFATFKYIGNDWAESCRMMAANPKVREWWAMTDGMQESDVSGALGSAEGPGWWTAVEEVFYTDGES